MHEIGHTLGFAHFHDAQDLNRSHIAGTLSNQLLCNANVMSYCRDRTRTTLFQDDIDGIQTLYPYSGAGLQCHSETGYPDIINEEYYLPLALGDVNSNGTASTQDMLLLQNVILGNPTSLSNYEIQKGAAINPSNTTLLSSQDLLQLQRYILGLDPFNEPVTSNQWLALADANGDGVLNFTDKSSTYLPGGSAVWGSDNLITRNEFTTELQSSCSLIDGDGSILTLNEFQIWVNNF